MFLIDVLRRKRQRQRRGPVRWFALERAGVRTPSVQLLPSGSPLASPSIRSIQRAVTQDSHLGKAVNQRMPGHFLADAGIPARQGCLCGNGVRRVQPGAERRRVPLRTDTHWSPTLLSLP